MADQYRAEIQQMMFVAGETGDIPPTTTPLVERIVQQQVISLSRANDLAHRRGTRVIGSDDLIFLIRHDREKVSRLQTFLSWKELRKNAKDKDDKSAGGADMADVLDADVDGLPLDGSGDAMTAAAAGGARKSKLAARAPPPLPWDVASFFAERAPEADGKEGEEAHQRVEDAEAHAAQLRRLVVADERTRAMTREEYCEWAEARQASFTRRKRLRFRDWSGLGVVTDGRVGEDVMDILGFLTFQMVQTLTEEALKVKGAEVALRAKTEDGRKGRRVREGPFAREGVAAGPVEPRHVQEAYRRLQRVDPGRVTRQGAMRCRPLRLF